MRGLIIAFVPALLAASSHATEFDPRSLFDAARAFSQSNSDTEQPFIQITGTKRVSYEKTLSLEGAPNSASLCVNPEQSLDLKILGRLEGGYSIRGEFNQSDFRSSEETGVISIRGEAERLDIGDIVVSETEPFFPLSSPTRGIRFGKKAGSIAYGGVVSLSKTRRRTEVLSGNGTQGPYSLSYVPVSRGSERLKIVEGLKKTPVPFDAYQIDYEVGTITFKHDIIEEEHLVEITYLEQGGVAGTSTSSLSATCNLDDSTVGSVSILKTSSDQSDQSGTFTSWGFCSSSKQRRIITRLALAHPERRSCAIAGSVLRAESESQHLDARVEWLNLRGPLEQFDGSPDPRSEMSTEAKLCLGDNLQIFAQCDANMNKVLQGTRTSCGFSSSMPFSTNIHCERIQVQDGNRSSSSSSLVLSREGRDHGISVSASSGIRDDDKTTGLATHFHYGNSDATQATGSVDYSVQEDHPNRLALMFDLTKRSGLIGSLSLACRLRQRGKQKVRKVLAAEYRTKENTPVQLGGKYEVKCLTPEERTDAEFREVQSLTGLSRINIGCFNLTYYPSLELSGEPSLSQHRLMSQWSLARSVLIGGCLDDTEYRPASSTEPGFENSAAKANCRITPNPSFMSEFQYERAEHCRANSNLERQAGWRINTTVVPDNTYSLEFRVSNLSKLSVAADSGVDSHRDRSIEGKASRELTAWLAVYLVAGVTRREAQTFAYSYSPGVGLTANASQATTVQFVYRATTWVDLLGRDEEKATLKVNAAETWVSASCGLEYQSLTRPISKTLTVSINASLHF